MAPAVYIGLAMHARLQHSMSALRMPRGSTSCRRCCAHSCCDASRRRWRPSCRARLGNDTPAWHGRRQPDVDACMLSRSTARGLGWRNFTRAPICHTNAMHSTGGARHMVPGQRIPKGPGGAGAARPGAGISVRQPQQGQRRRADGRGRARREQWRDGAAQHLQPPLPGGLCRRT